MRYFATPILLAGILLFGTMVRIWGVDHDLPYIYHPDEPINIEISQRMFRNSDPNPHLFAYPSFLFDLNSIAYISYYAVGKFDGRYSNRTDVLPLVSLGMGVSKAPNPGYVLLGRVLTIAFGVGT